MPAQIRIPPRPHGLMRWALRLPIGLYRLGLGGLLGRRFLLLTHTGRRSGQVRRTVLEVVRHDPASGETIVASGWGERADWLRNVEAAPRVTVQIGGRRMDALAERLSPAAAGGELLDYQRRHPAALKELVRFMGYQLDGTPRDVRALGERLPMVRFRPV